MSIELVFLLALATASSGEDVERSDAARRDVERCYRVAVWCRERGHDQEMRAQARKVLALDIDHEGARTMLGFVRVDDRWVRSPVTSEWVTAFQESVNADLRRLVSAEKPVRDAARTELLLTARIEGLSDLARHVERIHREADRAFERVAVEVRAQSSTLVGQRTVGVSLGTGSPVRLQLPELRSVRIGTTAVIPTGP